MPTAKNRGCNIHYRVSGSGPLLILQHGFFGSHADWKYLGYVDALKDTFTVAAVDSLAHGQSDISTDANHYRLHERAGDIVSVIDDLGHEKAHVLGYSMGGWMAIGVAQHFPERLASLSFGGWNCLEGSAPGLLKAIGKSELSWDEYMVKAKELSSPGSLEWVTGDVWTALSHCHEQLKDLEGAASAVIELEVPVLVYAGEEDYCHEPMKSFAAENDLSFLSIPGDHMQAMKDGAPQLAPAIKSLASGGR